MTTKRDFQTAQELSVYGYIRQHLDVFSDDTMTWPQELTEICLAMYMQVFDEWFMQESHEQYVLDTDENILSCKDGCGHTWRNAFGTFVLSKGDMHKWCFQFLANVCDLEDPRRNIMFGIIEAQHRNKHQSTFFCDLENVSLGGTAYYAYDGNAFCGKRGRIKYGEKAKKGDLITMTLDLRCNANEDTDSTHCGALSFTLNGKEQGVLVDDLDVNKEYSMAIVSYRSWEKIKLCHTM